MQKKDGDASENLVFAPMGTVARVGRRKVNFAAHTSVNSSRNGEEEKRECPFALLLLTTKLFFLHILCVRGFVHTPRGIASPPSPLSTLPSFSTHFLLLLRTQKNLVIDSVTPGKKGKRKKAKAAARCVKALLTSSA